MTTLTLTPVDLRDYTGRRRSDAQARVLEHMGVPFTRRPDGTLVVLRSVAEAMAGGARTITRREPQLQP
jgi:succinate dehydrogenase/fumarate reductase flavoprotein subunit